MRDQYLDARRLQNLVRKIYLTIPEVEKWEDVIREILTLSGATKGIMALRADRSSDFHVPSRILQSPLIVNFELAFVASFVDKFIDLDPWTPIELMKHPHLPYALSDHLSLAELKASPFWEWLAPQFIDDTVVLDIGRTEGFWVGLNIYFEQSDPKVRSNVLDILETIRPDLRTAWKMGETYRIMTHQDRIHLNEVSKMPLSAFFCKSDGTVKMVTNRLRKMSEEWNILSTIEPRIRFKTSTHQSIFENMIQSARDTGDTLARRLDLDGPAVHLSVSRITANEDVIGRKSEQFLAILDSPDDERRLYLQNVVKRSPMTGRESALCNHLCNGGTVRGFAKAVGISPHTADFHWRNLKQKLGLSAPKELCVLWGDE